MLEILIMSQGRSSLAARAQKSISDQVTPNEEIQTRIFVQDDGVHRERSLQQSSAEWVLFLDEDCYLPSSTYLQKFLELRQAHPEVAVWGGSYLSEKNSSYTTRAYNELCNWWVQLSLKNGRSANLLGGALALHLPTVRSHLPNNPIAWGGEDTFLLRALRDAKVTCGYSPTLNVYHAPLSQSFRRLARRGFLHGCHREKFHLRTPGLSPTDLFKSIKYARYWPVWFIHFCFLFWGLANQRFDLRNRQI